MDSLDQTFTTSLWRKWLPNAGCLDLHVLDSPTTTATPSLLSPNALAVASKSCTTGGAGAGAGAGALSELWSNGQLSTYRLPNPLPTYDPSLYLSILLALLGRGDLLLGYKRRLTIFDPHLFTCVQTRHGFRCKRRGCIACLITEARRRAWAIRMSAPTHAFVLTGAGHDHATVMGSIRRWRRYLDAQYGCPVKVCGSIETTLNGHIHIHGFIYVDGVLDALKLDMDFQAACNRAGLGDCWIDRIGGDDWAEYAEEIAGIDADREAAAAYYGYPTSSMVDDRLLDAFLELNKQGENYHLGFQSHDFFRDGGDGEHLTERAAKQRAYERAQKEWADDDEETDQDDVDDHEADYIAELTFFTRTSGFPGNAE